MFNTLDEQLFVCQSLLKERRWPPTGGLMEALEESLERCFHAPFPCCGVENDPWSRLEPIGYCLGGITPIGAFPVGASFLVGTTKGLILEGLETLRILWGAFLRRNSSTSLTNWDLNNEDGQKYAFLSSWRLVSPSWGCNWVILASRISKQELPIEYSCLWRIWARDLLRQVKALCWIKMVLFHKSRYS